jgi:hypothetical protein
MSYIKCHMNASSGSSGNKCWRRTDGHDKNNKALFATLRTRLKRTTPLKITCYGLNRIFTGAEYDEVMLSKARVVTCVRKIRFLRIATFKLTRCRTWRWKYTINVLRWEGDGWNWLLIASKSNVCYERCWFLTLGCYRMYSNKYSRTRL